MKIVNLDKMVAEEAKIVFLGVEHIIRECTLYEWAQFNERIGKLEDGDDEAIIALNEWAIKTAIPTLEPKTLNMTELKMAFEVSMIVFNGGISELGKKTKPLQEILKKL